MSEEQLKAFLEAVKVDASLQEQLKAAGNADAVVAIAKAAGYVISAEELQRAEGLSGAEPLLKRVISTEELKRAQAEVSEEEIEGLVGGKNTQYCCHLTS